jgi:hypothetical protein
MPAQSRILAGQRELIKRLLTVPREPDCHDLLDLA